MAAVLLDALSPPPPPPPPAGCPHFPVAGQGVRNSTRRENVCVLRIIRIHIILIIHNTYYTVVLLAARRGDTRVCRHCVVRASAQLVALSALSGCLKLYLVSLSVML
jgi:hypothetical protein